MKIETPVLKRLGPVPFWRGREKCLASLEDAYCRAAEKASRLLASSKENRCERADLGNSPANMI